MSSNKKINDINICRSKKFNKYKKTDEKLNESENSENKNKKCEKIHILSIGTNLVENAVKCEKKLREINNDATKIKTKSNIKKSRKVKLTTIRKKILKYLREKHSRRFNNFFQNINPIPLEFMLKFHSNSYREYCNQVINDDLNKLIFNICQQLALFQKRAYDNAALNSTKSKKRFIMGFREIKSFLSTPHVPIKMLIIAPNIRNIDVLNAEVLELIKYAKSENIPIIFALNKYKLGAALHVRSNISSIAIIDHNNVETSVTEIFKLTKEAIIEYQRKIFEFEHCIERKTESNFPLLPI